jgi:3-(3-hydroxy-phenyl)propionate hydroxylase
VPDDPRLAPPTRAATAVTGGHYELPVYPFVEPAELKGQLGRHPVVIVGGGLAGLTAACDFSLRGIPAVLLDEDDTVGVRGAASRGICYAQKSLELFARLGIFGRMAAKGVQWSVGRTFAGDEEVYSFDLRAQPGHAASCQPPFINLQQFYVEWFLVDRIYELGVVDLRWRNKVTGLQLHADHVALEVETPVGRYTLECAWVVDCSGSHSPLPRWLGVGVQGTRVPDRWCISDVRFARPPPAERWTWIEAPFNDGRAVWQHLMADGVWRLDYQMAPDAEPDEVSTPREVDERLRRQFGADVDYELVWVGPYAYRSQCLERLRAGRVFFAGDAAHVMSPFGARGGNSGIQDVENLVWKLALVLQGRAPEALLDSYDAERRPAARLNIRTTERTTRFLSPAPGAERLMRDAVLALARRHPFARALVNTGRLSSPMAYEASPLACGTAACRHVQNVALRLPDGRAADLVTLMQQLDGAIALVAAGPLAPQRAAQMAVVLPERYPVRCLHLSRSAPPGSGLPLLGDPEDRLAQQLGLEPDAARLQVALIRPDLHCAGVLHAPDAAALERAVRRVLGYGDE